VANGGPKTALAFKGIAVWAKRPFKQPFMGRRTVFKKSPEIVG